MLNCAGVCSKLAAAKWLRQQGAQWPSRLRAHDPKALCCGAAKCYNGRELKAVMHLCTIDELSCAESDDMVG
eukprot:20183-Heterococcus_DN1.PRE.2